jgi:hypothetical protein
MSNVVRTWEDEANAAGEIELTDAQLGAVVGACDDYSSHHSYHPDYYCCDPYHKKFEKRVKICVEFDYKECYSGGGGYSNY